MMGLGHILRPHKNIFENTVFKSLLPSKLPLAVLPHDLGVGSGHICVKLKTRHKAGHLVWGE